MQLIELHILQSFPVSCLNRDDVGAPKTAVFGGVPRARLSSQCLKRAIRLHGKETCPALFAGERSKLIVEPIAKVAETHGAPADKAMNLAKKFCHELATVDEQAFKAKGVHKVKTLMFLSPSEREEIGRELAVLAGSGKDSKAINKAIKSAATKALDAQLKDAADIALFGRMVASDHSLTLEGAAMFSHALSTHRADNDIDFYTAVDDRQKEDSSISEEDRAGSGMMGTLEFTSAVYYRYAAINLGLLSDDDHLGSLKSAERQEVIGTFIRSCLMATPGARKNSMNAHTLPAFVLGLFRKAGQPVQLVNAFEDPVRPRSGLLAESRKRLLEHHAQLKETWDISCETEASIPEVNVNEFVKTLIGHVQ